eukprot:XP_001703958.1 Hypothetical protein GL50803_36890 [Giardia lamblia ATCC 50803]
MRASAYLPIDLCQRIKLFCDRDISCLDGFAIVLVKVRKLS